MTQTSTMNNLNWIWLPPDRFPDLQETDGIASLAASGQHKFAVAEFALEVDLPVLCVAVHILVSADTAYRLAINGRDICSGPAPVGGDWLPLPRCPRYYADELAFDPQSATRLAFLATVRLGQIRGTDSSLGHGGFALRAVARWRPPSQRANTRPATSASRRHYQPCRQRLTAPLPTLPPAPHGATTNPATSASRRHYQPCRQRLTAPLPTLPPAPHGATTNPAPPAHVCPHISAYDFLDKPFSIRP
ncbi:MAG: hypothetical protein ACOX9C_07425 [Kiritimatiellia bacterium]|jgi:hypothetical protein